MCMLASSVFYFSFVSVLHCRAQYIYIVSFFFLLSSFFFFRFVQRARTTFHIRIQHSMNTFECVCECVRTIHTGKHILHFTHDFWDWFDSFYFLGNQENFRFQPISNDFCPIETVEYFKRKMLCFKLVEGVIAESLFKTLDLIKTHI